MTDGFFSRIPPTFLLSLVAIISGCSLIQSCVPSEKYERTVRLSAPLQPGSVFTAQTHNGSITITGAEAADCNLTATIIARAPTEEDAKKLAEEIKIKLEPFGNKLTIKIEKPAFMKNKSVSVNLNAAVPNRTNLELTTHNGGVSITNITGEVNCTTHNGAITALQVSDTIKLQTHNGSVVCREISGDARLTTHNGEIRAVYSENAPAVFNTSMVTHNGSIDFTGPPNLSAVVEVSTHNGSISTKLPITVIGDVSKRKLRGTIGTGQGKLHVESHNGSIKIR